MRIRSRTKKGSLTSARSGSNNKPSPLLPDDDQCFLMHFIMGTYFGPDLKEEHPPKSVLQRKSEGLPLYTSHQLSGSHIKTVEVERIYYHVLRKANQSSVVKASVLELFLKGDLSIPPGHAAAVYPQFPELFPCELHAHSKLGRKYRIIKNISFINNPEVSYIKPEDMERFKKLTGLEDLLLDEDAARSHDPSSNEELSPSESPQDSKRQKQEKDISPSNSMPNAGAIVDYKAPNGTEHKPDAVVKPGPSVIFLQSQPTEKDLANIIAATKNGFALTGSAAMGHVGPTVGQMDIGECEDSYLFRVSLPGVKRDAKEFSCEVDENGKVLIRGVTTTGEKKVYRFSQMFEMQSQNLCPPGHFSIMFQLPGPVDPQQFSGSFGTDGILEGIVMKKS